MKTIIIKELRERKFSLIAYCLASLGFLWLYISLFPSMHAQSETLNKLYDSLPKGFSDAFGFDSNFLATIHGFLAGEFYSLTWQLLVIIFMVSRAGSSFAGEIERGTIGTLLAQPISRTKLFFAKYSASVIALLVFIVVSVLLAIPISMLYNIDVWSRNFLALSFVSFLFAMAVYSFTLFLSAISSERSKVYGVLGGLLFIMYVLNIVSGMRVSFKNLQYASIFHYFKPSEILVYNRLNWIDIGVFASITLIFSALALFVFNKRDISI